MRMFDVTSPLSTSFDSGFSTIILSCDTYSKADSDARYLDTTPAVHSKVSGDQVRELIRLSGRVSKVVESGDVDRAVNGGRWGKMVVIGISDVPEEMAQIESSIILKYGSIDACANIAPGGEGSAMMRGPPFYNYVCLGRLDE